MKKKLATLLLALSFACGVGGLLACNDINGDASVESSGTEMVFTMQTAYVKAQELGYEGSLEEFIASISGKDGLNGLDGVNGQDGVGISSVYLNENNQLVVKYTDDTETIIGGIPACVHSYGDWAVEEQATCTSIGVNYRTCTDCGYVEYEILSAVGHTYQEDYYTTKANNNDKYFLERSCSVCHCLEKREVQPTMITVAPTCTEEGYSQEIYVENGKTYQWGPINFVAQWGHSLVSGFVVDEGETLCEHGGAYAVYCTNVGCGYVQSSVEVGVQGHHSLSWSTKVAPTLTSEGLLEGVCTGCTVSVGQETVVYEGCGQTVEKKLSVLNEEEYTTRTYSACGDAKTISYSITVDSKTFTFVDEIIEESLHVLNGQRIDYNQTQIFQEGMEDKFSNAPMTCVHANPCSFCCENCGGQYVIYNVVLPHTKPEGLAEDCTEYECTDCHQTVTE